MTCNHVTYKLVKWKKVVSLTSSFSWRADFKSWILPFIISSCKKEKPQDIRTDWKICPTWEEILQFLSPYRSNFVSTSSLKSQWKKWYESCLRWSSAPHLPFSKHWINSNQKRNKQIQSYFMKHMPFKMSSYLNLIYLNWPSDNDLLIISPSHLYGASSWWWAFVAPPTPAQTVHSWLLGELLEALSSPLPQSDSTMKHDSIRTCLS